MGYNIIVILGDDIIKNHFIRFLSAAKKYTDIMPTVYDREGVDVVIVHGLVENESNNIIEVEIGAPGAGYMFQ